VFTARVGCVRGPCRVATLPPPPCPFVHTSLGCACNVVQVDLRFLELLFLNVVKGEVDDRLDVVLELFSDRKVADGEPQERYVTKEGLVSLVGT
jgi:hypothetical protein